MRRRGSTRKRWIAFLGENEMDGLKLKTGLAAMDPRADRTQLHSRSAEVLPPAPPIIDAMYGEKKAPRAGLDFVGGLHHFVWQIPFSFSVSRLVSADTSEPIIVYRVMMLNGPQGAETCSFG